MNTALKIIAFALTFGLNFAVGFVMISFLLVALNGFRESEANYAFLVFIVGGLTISLILAIGAVFAVGWGLNKGWNPFLAGSLPIFGSVILGIGLKIVLFFLAIGAAGLARSYNM